MEYKALKLFSYDISMYVPRVSKYWVGQRLTIVITQCTVFPVMGCKKSRSHGR